MISSASLHTLAGRCNGKAKSKEAASFKRRTKIEEVRIDEWAMEPSFPQDSDERLELSKDRMSLFEETPVRLFD